MFSRNEASCGPEVICLPPERRDTWMLTTMLSAITQTQSDVTVSLWFCSVLQCGSDHAGILGELKMWMKLQIYGMFEND